MAILVTGLVLFIGIHLVPSSPALRGGLVERLGEKRYKGIYAVTALLGLVLIIIGKGAADFEPLYAPPAWGRQAAMILMPASIVLFPAANMPTNIKRFTRHPMLWGLTLWSVAHLLANGDRASVLLFGTFGAFGLFAMWSANRRGAQKSDTVVPVAKDAMVLVAGLVAWALLLFLHPYLFGVRLVHW